jgi:hypothetical protein
MRLSKSFLGAPFFGKNHGSLVRSLDEISLILLRNSIVDDIFASWWGYAFAPLGKAA